MISLKTVKEQVSTKVFVLVGFLIGSFVIYSQYLWNPDPHHDGIMYSAAIGFANGLRPNVDYFAQYGPLASVIQGFALLLFGESLTVLRLFTATLLILSGLMFAFRAYQRFGIRVASLLWFLWALSGPMGLPWSSVISTFILVTFLFFSFKIKNKNVELNSNAFLFFSQIVLLGSLVRVQLFLVFVLLIAVTPLYKSRFSSIFYCRLFLATVFTISVTAFLLLYFDIWNSYYKQSFEWALSHYATPRITRTYLSGLIWFLLIPVFLYLYYKLIRMIIPLSRIRKTLLGGGSLFLLLTFYIFCFTYVNKEDDSLFSPYFFSIEFFRHLLISIDYLPVSLILYIVIKRISEDKSSLKACSAEDSFLLAVALGTLAQLYPLFDPWHLWMIIPVLILCLVLIKFEKPLRAYTQSWFLAVVTITLVALGFQFLHSGLNQNYAFKSKAMVGMTSSRSDAPQLDATMLELEKIDSGRRKIAFLCTDGIYASANGKYMSEGPLFVDWGLSRSLITPTTNTLFACNYTSSQISHFASQGWVINFILDSGHVNSRGIQLFNVLMDRKLP